MPGGIQITYDSNIRDLMEAVREIENNAMPSEAAKALNRTITFVRNEVATEVSGRTGISRALIRRRVKPIRGRRASPRKLTVAGFVGEASVPVSKVSPKPRKAGTGVTYKTVTGQPIDPRAFFARLKNGKQTAWVRKTKKRGSMREVQIKIDLFLRRSVRRVTRNPARQFFSRTFLENLETRVDKDLAKRGLTR